MSGGCSSQFTSVEDSINDFVPEPHKAEVFRILYGKQSRFILFYVLNILFKLKLCSNKTD